MSSYRTINIDGETWSYKVGKTRVDIRGPSGQKYIPTCAELKGLDPFYFEKGQHKRTQDGMVFPKEIRAFIQGAQ